MFCLPPVSETLNRELGKRKKNYKLRRLTSKSIFFLVTSSASKRFAFGQTKLAFWETLLDIQIVLPIALDIDVSLLLWHMLSLVDWHRPVNNTTLKFSLEVKTTRFLKFSGGLQSVFPTIIPTFRRTSDQILYKNGLRFLKRQFETTGEFLSNIFGFINFRKYSLNDGLHLYSANTQFIQVTNNSTFQSTRRPPILMR